MSLDVEPRLIDGFAATGRLTIPAPPGFQAVLVEAYAGWRQFFGHASKFSTPGNKAQPSGYMPFCEANGCEMKESFYLQPGMSPPPAAKTATRRVMAALQDVVAGVAEQLNREAGEPLVRYPHRACLRVLRYPALDGEPESPLMRELAGGGAIRTPAHTDLNALTLQPWSTAAGLEVQGPDGVWRPADPGPEQIVVHAGRELEARAAGAVRATLHRVRNPGPEARGLTRLAMALFVS